MYLFFIFQNPFRLYINNANTQVCVTFWSLRLLADSTYNMPKILPTTAFSHHPELHFWVKCKEKWHITYSIPLFLWCFICYLHCLINLIKETPSKVIVPHPCMNIVLRFPRKKTQRHRFAFASFLRSAFLTNIWEGVKEVEFGRQRN